MHEQWDNPLVNRRVVGALVVSAPILFVGSYGLALWQRATHDLALLIALIALGMCLGAAAAIHAMGARAIYAFGAVAAAASIAAALFGR